MNKLQLEQCIREYGREIYFFCYHLTGNVQEAKELYQDTFLKAVELMKNINYENNPKSFLISIALRLWKNKKRKYAWRMRIAETESLIEETEVEESGCCRSEYCENNNPCVPRGNTL